MNRLSTTILIAIGCGCLAILFAMPRAQRTGYVDLAKAMNETAEGQAATASLTDFARTKSAEVKAAQADAAKLRAAKADDVAIKAAEQKADDLAQAAQAEFNQRQNAGAAKISAGLARILSKLRVEHGFVAVAAKPLDVDPSLDVTAELVARYNAGDGAPPPPDEVAAKKIADLEQKAAADEKKIAALEASKSLTGAAVVASNGKPKVNDQRGVSQ